MALTIETLRGATSASFDITKSIINVECDGTGIVRLRISTTKSEEIKQALSIKLHPWAERVEGIRFLRMDASKDEELEYLEKHYEQDVKEMFVTLTDEASNLVRDGGELFIIDFYR
eukprot:CFRG3386T1